MLSLASVVRVAEQLNNETEFDTLELAVLYKKLPDDLKENILSPFVSIEHNQARISARLIDSDENLNRGEFVSELEQFIKEDLIMKILRFQWLVYLFYIIICYRAYLIHK